MTAGRDASRDDSRADRVVGRQKGKVQLAENLKATGLSCNSFWLSTSMQECKPGNYLWGKKSVIVKGNQMIPCWGFLPGWGWN